MRAFMEDPLLIKTQSCIFVMYFVSSVCLSVSVLMCWIKFCKQYNRKN